MSGSTARCSTAGVAAIAAAIGLAFVSTVHASAHDLTTDFKNACAATAAGITVHETPTPVSITVNHSPLNPGVYSVQPGSQTVPSSAQGATIVNISRLSLVYKIDPSNFVSASVIQGTGSGYSGTAVVNRVNASGALDPSGSYIALNGGGTIAGASPAGSNGSEAGLTILSGSSFRLPAVEFTTVATNPTAYVNTDGDAGKYGSSKNYLTYLARASVVGVPYFVPITCVPSDKYPRVNADLGTVLTPNAGAGNLHS